MMIKEKAKDIYPSNIAMAIFYHYTITPHTPTRESLRYPLFLQPLYPHLQLVSFSLN